MIDIDSRPDLIKLMTDLKQYTHKFVNNDQIIIAIPEFQKKTNEPWYGIGLVCRPNRTSISSYIVSDEHDLDKQIYIDNFDSQYNTLEDIIKISIKKVTTCKSCNEKRDLNDMYVSKHNGYICTKCKNKQRR